MAYGGPDIVFAIIQLYKTMIFYDDGKNVKI